MALFPLGMLLLPLAQTPSVPVEALLYSTMPSTFAHSPEMAMDGDPATNYRTVYGMGDGDSFTVILGRPIRTKSIRVETGADNGDLLTNGYLEASADGTTFRKIADFDAKGVAESKGLQSDVFWLRIRVNRRRSVAHLVISEIKIDSETPISHVQRGHGRGFVDYSRTPDLAKWAIEAERKMESFWPNTEALLYTDGFITPNAVHVIYEVGPRVTPVAATGGGVMTVNGDYARHHADDTGLVVHEAAHAIQSGGSPGWLVEAVADYVRWIKFEPQNFTYGIDLVKGTPHDPYRSGAAFIAWLELHYDRKLATKLNEATRFGTYRDSLFESYCGKPIDVLYQEFVTAYKADKANLLVKPVSPGMRPRPLPTVRGSAGAVPLPFGEIGFAKDGSKFPDSSGFDAGGAAYSAQQLGSTILSNGVTFKLGTPDGKNILVLRGQTLEVVGKHKSIWLLGAAVDGAQREMPIEVTYSDGTTTTFIQNFSDWYEPSDFPGESIAKKTEYRLMADGTKDPRAFYVYSYGFALDAEKAIQRIKLPNNPNIRLLSISVAD